jgi:tetratricopeptide (TPR) repeat protein
MSIDVICQCGKKLIAKDEHAGKRAKCPACGQIVMIPGTPLPAYDVFISHSHEDKPIADAICASLEASRIRCWVAPRDIMPGKEWGEAIIDGISQCRAMVLVFSSNSNQSGQVKREVERAVSKGAIIVPFKIEDVPMSKSMEYFLSTPHWLDAMTPPLENHLAKLAQTVRSLLGGVGARAEQTSASVPPNSTSAPAAAPASGARPPSRCEEPQKSRVPAANSLFDRALEKQNSGDWQGSLANLNEAIGLDRTFARAYSQRAYSKLVLGNQTGALADANEAVRLAPDCVEYYVTRANAKRICGDWNGAWGDYDEAIRRNPNHANARVNRGNARFDKGDWDGAIAEFDQAVASDPTQNVYSNRGIAWANKGQWIAAIADYDQAIRLNPNDRQSYANRGLAKQNMGDQAAAIPDFDQAIRLQPTWDIYRARAIAKTNLGDSAGAVADYTEVIRLQPNDWLSYVNRGLARANMGDIDGAMADYDESLRLDPGNPGAYWNRGRIWWFHRHDEARARADFKKALELAPQFASFVTPDMPRLD